MVAPGRRRERRGHGEQPGPAHGEDPVELGEAQVVTDAEPDLDAARRRRAPARRRAARARTRGSSRRRRRRRTCASCGRWRSSSPAGSIRHEVLKSRSAPGRRSAMLPASRWMPSSRAHERGGGRASGRRELLGAGVELVRRAEQVPLLGQRDELGAVRGRGGDQALRRRSRLRSLSMVELSWIAATRIPSASASGPVRRRGRID